MKDLKRYIYFGLVIGIASLMCLQAGAISTISTTKTLEKTQGSTLLANTLISVGNPDNDDTQKMLKALRDHYLPNMMLILRAGGTQSASITEIAPFTRYYAMVNEKATAHVCINQNCKLPTNEVQKMLELLGESD